nr:TMV resistance protein N-like isoform X2 [Ipomoea batatas]
MAPQETSSMNYKCSHDVFLSGSDDTGKTFADHLYTALVQAGFRAFRGHETIIPNKCELKKTIQESRMSVVVFSKWYAYSSWCLDQLVMILEEKRRSSGHAVLPVFYDLDPSDVRKQKGVVAAAMETHKRRFSSEGDQCDKEGEEMMKRWKAVLGEAADLGGMVLQNLSDGHEAKFIQKTLKVIANTLRRTALSVPNRLIGMHMRAHHINCWGSIRVRGLKLNMDEKNEWGRFLKQSMVNLYCTDKDLDELDYFGVDGFAEMQNLELLQLSSVSVCGSYENFPKNLRWLSWHNFELETLPGEMNVGGVAVIDLSHSKLKQVWKGTKFLRFLKILNLSHSKELIATPNFTGLPNLEHLILNHCSKLASIHDSIGKLEMLILLDLQNCARLRRLPDSVSALKSLETLDIAGCSSLDSLPAGLKAMESLKLLRADGISMDKVAEPRSTNIIIKSWLWKTKKCPRMYLGSLPRSLVTLSLFNCSLSDAAFPREFGDLSSLENLNLGKNMISVLPNGIRRLSRLRMLEVEFCRRLTSLVALPNIEKLRISYCEFLQDITFQEESYNGCKIERGSCHDQIKDESEEVRLGLMENVDTEVFYGRSLSDRSSENVIVKMSSICRF